MIIGVNRPALGDVAWVLENATPMYQGETLSSVVITFSDITKIKASLEALRNSEIPIQNIIDHTPLGVCVTDVYGKFESVNKAYCEIYGYSEKELLGEHFTIVVPEEYKSELSVLHDKFFEEETEIRGEWTVVTSSNEQKSILADAAHIFNSNNEPKKVTFVMDITKEKEIQKELENKNKILEEMTTTDYLTGVKNRRALFTIIEDEIKRSTRYNLSFSIALIDIDHFKRVNDDYGHIHGDEVLKSVASQITDICRDDDIVGRYGGEEFMVLMPNTSTEDAVILIERIRESFIDSPMTDKKISITMSGGISTYSNEPLVEFINKADSRL
jgi:diguanylate cyclase (GGDEF)-like protein/PAS domain S-box-containing protein